MKKVHLVYSSGEQIFTPYAIGRELALRLRSRYDVEVHDPRADYVVTPDKNSVLIGHPVWESSSVFTRSVKLKGWKRRICLQPFAPGDPRQIAHLIPVLDFCDLYLAITGPYWMKVLPQTHFRHLSPKTVHVDLAISRRDFPVVKTDFNPPGRRRFVYIGNHPWYKNLGYLNEIAGMLPEMEFAWIGSTKKRFGNLRQLGRHNFAEPAARELVGEFDFMVTVGSADANPTTILEAMAWGLIPVCTPQSGYEDFPGIVNVPLNNRVEACRVIKDLQAMDPRQLLENQAANWKSLDDHFTWDRFAAQVIDAIESDVSVPATRPRFQDSAVLAWYQFASPNSRWRPRRVLRNIKQRVRRVLQ